MGFDEELDASLKTEESKPLDAVGWCGECALLLLFLFNY